MTDMRPVLFSIGPIEVSSYGVMLVLAFVLGSYVFWQKAREEHYDEEEVFDLILMSVLWSVFGARLAYILINFDDFGLNLYYWVAVWYKPGFFWIGALVGSVGAVMRFVKKRGWDLFEVLDLGVIGVSLGQALINLGIFLSGGSVGRVTSLVVGVNFPGLFEKRHPVGLYGLIAWLAVFGLLWWLEGKYRKFEWYQLHKGNARPGFLSFTYLTLLGLVGFGLGLVSQPSHVVGGINVGLIVRWLLIFVGIGGILVRSGVKWSDLTKVFGGKSR